MPDNVPRADTHLRDLLDSGFRYALSLTRDPTHAEDVVQDAWVSVLRARGGRNKAYLFRAIRCRVVDAHRRSKLRAVESLTEDRVADESQHTDERYSLVGDGLRRALADLKVDEREALRMSTVEGYTARDIAEMTGRSRGTVLSMIHRARLKLRRALLAGAAAAVLLIIGVAILLGHDAAEPSVSQRIAAEIAENHARNEAVAVAGNNVASVGARLDRLDFRTRRPARLESGLRVVGGRHCSLQGQVAAQIKLIDESGRFHTLYQARATGPLEGVQPIDTVVDGVRTRIWREGNLIMGLASAPE